MLIKLDQIRENQGEILQLLWSIHSAAGPGAVAEADVLRKPCQTKEELRDLCQELELEERRSKMVPL